MPRPYITLTIAQSADARYDVDRPDSLNNRLEEYRIQQVRGEVDAILTSAAKINQEDPEYPIRDLSGKEPTIVIVDKNAELNPKSTVLGNHSRKIRLVVSKKAQKNRVKKILDVRKDAEVLELGEYAVNLEDMLWELGREGIKRIHLEADPQTTMRFIDHQLVDEVYVMIAPLILGQDYADIYASKTEKQLHMELEGILQYGDHVVLHYLIRKRR